MACRQRKKNVIQKFSDKLTSGKYSFKNILLESRANYKLPDFS